MRVSLDEKEEKEIKVTLFIWEKMKTRFFKIK